MKKMNEEETKIMTYEEDGWSRDKDHDLWGRYMK